MQRFHGLFCSGTQLPAVAGSRRYTGHITVVWQQLHVSCTVVYSCYTCYNSSYMSCYHAIPCHTRVITCVSFHCPPVCSGGAGLQSLLSVQSSYQLSKHSAAALALTYQPGAGLGMQVQLLTPSTSVCLSGCLSVNVPACLSVCLPVCLSL